ncbi:hypothetical protein PoB_007561800 [Plakobranchus ocellatus]|uniref:Uncharacterized protein n=1 Tax=Plakobranchus ocellatus TaxID=259542 RepID=A0AAV4DXW9_9GAST|nr:hypothetical protein PoB_007561800 [Plakobranchus ocellatus]
MLGPSGTTGLDTQDCAALETCDASNLQPGSVLSERNEASLTHYGLAPGRATATGSFWRGAQSPPKPPDAHHIEPSSHFDLVKKMSSVGARYEMRHEATGKDQMGSVHCPVLG